MVTVQLQHGSRSISFDGDLIAEVKREDALRWPEFRIWRHADGGYMAQRAGCSVVYHRADTTCTVRSGAQRGSPATVDDLPDEAEPCEYCQPPYPENLGDDEKVRFEFPRSQIRRFRTAIQVIRFFTTWRDPETGDLNTRVTKPVAALLEQAAAADEQFAQQGLLHEGTIEPQGDDDDATSPTGHQPGRGEREAG